MNWLLLLVLLVLILCIAQGYRRGLLRIIYSLVSWVIIFVFVTCAKPYIHDFLVKSTSIHESIQTQCEDKIRQAAEEQTADTANEKVNNINSEIARLGVSLPESVLSDILTKTTDAAGDFLEENGVYQELASAMADFVIDGIAFFIALIIAAILVHVISSLLGIVSKIPILSGINRVLGLFAGGIYGLILVWIVFYVIALCGTSETGRTLISYIYQNPFLTALYENNLILTFILHFL